MWKKRLIYILVIKPTCSSLVVKYVKLNSMSTRLQYYSDRPTKRKKDGANTHAAIRGSDVVVYMRFPGCGFLSNWILGFGGIILLLEQ